MVILRFSTATLLVGLSLWSLPVCGSDTAQAVATVTDQQAKTIDSDSRTVQSKSWRIAKFWQEWWHAFTVEYSNSLNRYADMLVSWGCVEVSDQNYPAVYAAIKQVSEQACLKMPRTFVIDKNTREGLIANVPDFNAMADGIDRNVGLILIAKSLVDALTTDELKGIVAHECAHITKTHMRTMLKVALPVLLAQSVASVELWRSAAKFGRARFYALFVSVWLLPPAITSYVSRRCETEADAVAVQLARCKDLATALDKLEAHDAQEHPFSAKIYGVITRWAPFLLSHPTNEQRKKNIEKIVIS